MSDADRWNNVRAIFDAAVVLQGDDRAALIRERCGDDRTLQVDVESLLMADGARGSRLEQPVSPALRGRALKALAGGPETHNLAPGAQLETYTIAGILGTGGMGEVYRAHDTTLGREVAIKILPSRLNDRELRERVEREARLLAALNHPNIGAIYGIAHSNGTRGLVLELVDGETLAERIDKQTNRSRGLRVRDALSIALQIAEALEAAHERGIVHRDLKPGNIKISGDGRVKVLDFGVASFAGESDSEAPTHVLLGTPPYMSPEQARGEPVDRRADVWAFGCILYEILTGERAFNGSDTTETLSRILHVDPDLSRVPPDVPSEIVRLMALCLEKDRAKRLSQVAIARFTIAEALADPGATTAGINDHRRRRQILQALALGILVGALTALTVAWYSRSSQPSATAPLTRLLIGVTPAEHVGGTEGRPTRTAFAISPDGTLLVFSALGGNQRALYMRRLDRADAVKMEGTAGAERSVLFSQWPVDRLLGGREVFQGSVVWWASGPGGRGGVRVWCVVGR